MQLDLTPEERDDVIHGLQMRICVIETGTHTLRANDAVACGQPKLVRALSDEQKQLVVRLEELVKKVTQSGSLNPSPWRSW